MYVYCTHITVRYLLSYSDKIWYAKFNEKSSKIKQNVNKCKTYTEFQKRQQLNGGL